MNPDDFDVYPKEFVITPSEFLPNRIPVTYEYDIRFRYGGELQDVPESDWQDVWVRFWIYDEWSNPWYRRRWHLVGKTDFHQKNNYMTSAAGCMLEAFAYEFVQTFRQRHLKWFILRLNDMSLPWGGLFWIGLDSEATWLTLDHRVDEYGNPYEIVYQPYTRRVYAIPHETHRYGRNVDLHKWSALSEWNSDPDWGLEMRYDFLVDIAADYYFGIYVHSSHYHLTYL